MIRENDPSITAVCNLLAAVAAGMMSSGRGSELGMVLSLFEQLNKQTITDEAVLATLISAIDVQRAVQAQMDR